jgi:CheY-like chemotaxis protein
VTESVRLILAEDDDFLRQLLQMQCERMGAIVAPVCDGEAAVSLALSYEYDILLMDIHMPKCGGIQAMTILRQLGYDRPIVAMSADDVEAEGFSSVLKKPLTEQALQQLLQQETHHPALELVVSADLLQQFLQGLILTEQQLEQACQTKDWPELQRLSHKLKGTAGSFGFPQLSKAADTLQRAIQHHHTDAELTTATMQLLHHIQEANHE